MNLKSLLYMVTTLKRIQSELKVNDLLTGLTLVYELPPAEHSAIQKEIYKLSHPAMENYQEKDNFEVELVNTKFIFIRKD